MPRREFDGADFFLTKVGREKGEGMEKTGVLQDFFAELTAKGAANIEKALVKIPTDKQTWSPQEGTRSALNQVAEVALINATIAEIYRFLCLARRL